MTTLAIPLIATRRLPGYPGNYSPAAWYAPRDIKTLFQDAAGTVPVTTVGQSVLCMKDKSGNGLHLTQATASKAPTYQLDGNGKPCLLFDGVDDYLSNANTVSGNAQSIVTGATASGTSTATLYDVTVSASDRLHVRSWNAASGFVAAWYNGTTVTGKGTAGSALPTVLTAEIDKVTPATGLRVNGATIASSNTFAPGGIIGTFLGSSTGSAAFFAGNFYGLVQLARAVTTQERSDLELYLGLLAGRY